MNMNRNRTIKNILPITLFIMLASYSCSSNTFEIFDNSKELEAEAVARAKIIDVNPQDSTVTSYKSGDSILIEIKFDNTVNVDTTGGIPSITLADGMTAVYVSGSGTNTLVFAYIVQPGDSFSSIDYTAANALVLNGGSITDLQNNDVDLTLPAVGTSGLAAFLINIDGILPELTAVTIASNNTNDTTLAKTGNIITLNITTSETLSEAPVVTIAGNGVAVSGSGPYIAEYTLTGAETEGNIPFTINFTDAAGNAGIEVIDTTDTSFVIFDNTSPVFNSIALANDAVDTFINSAETANNAVLADTLSSAGYDSDGYKLVVSTTTCDSSLVYSFMPQSDSADFGVDGVYKICIELKDNAGNAVYGESDFFTLDTTAPIFTSLLGANEAEDNLIEITEKNSTNEIVTLTASGNNHPTNPALYTLILSDNPSITCDAGQTYGSSTIPLINTMSDIAGDYVVCVKLEDAAGNITYGESTQITNDTAGVSITESAASTDISEAGTTDSYDVVLTSKPTADVIIDILADTQVNINSASSVQITFTSLNWSVPQTILVSAVDDSIDEDGDNNVTPHTAIIAHDINTSLTIDTDYDALAGSLGNVTANITDNDTATVILTQSSGTTDISEAGITDSYDVVLTSEPTADVTITINNDAEVSTDKSTVTFTSANWNTAQTVTANAINDDIDEDGDNNLTTHTGNTSHTSASLDSNYNGIAIVSVTANITDNDNAGITITESGTTDVSEAGITDSYDIKLATKPIANVVINIVSSDTTNGVLVNGGASAQFIFTSANWLTSQTVNVSAVDDSSVEVSPHTALINHNIDGATADSIYSGISILPVSVNITDNDNAGVTITESGTTDVSEAGITDSYDVVLTSKPSDDVIITINNDAEVSTDKSTVTFTSTNWSTTQTVTVNAINDDIDEDGNNNITTHTGSISHSSASSDTNYNSIAIDSVTANITDNDTATVILTQSSGTTDISEAGITDSYDVVLTSKPSDDVIITINNDAEVSTDKSTVTFTSTNWSTTQTVTVNAINDDIDEDGNNNATTHTGSTSHSSASSDTNYNSIAIVSVTANITDNDNAGFTIIETGAGTIVNENGTTDDYTVILNTKPTSNVVLLLNSTGASIDTPSLTFSPVNWDQPQKITVSIINDFIAQGNRTGNISHSIDIGSSAAEYSAVITQDISPDIIDDDTAGVLITEIDSNTIITEGGANDLYTVKLTSEPTGNILIDITRSNEVTLNGGTSTSISFTSANWSTAQTINVSMTDDTISGGLRFDTISHAINGASTAPEYNLVTINDVTVTIIDDDSIITESGGTTDITEGGATDTYDIVLPQAPTADVTVTITANGSQAATDLTTLTFTSANWLTPQTITITAMDDNVYEGNHTEIIYNSFSSADVVYNGLNLSITANITDNDTASVSITESGGSSDITEGGGTDSYDVVLTSIPSSNVTVTISTDNEVLADKTTLTFTPGTWNVTQTVTVSAINDSIDEDGDNNATPHTGTITHTSASGDNNYNALVINPVLANITDNDTAAVTITQSGGTTNVIEGGATDSYDIKLSTKPMTDVTITITTGAETSTDKSTLTFTSGNWNIAQTVTASAINDLIDEDGDNNATPHTGTITHTSASGDSFYDAITIADVTVNITDNDTAAVILTQSGGTTNVTEGGTADSYDIKLATKPIADVLVNITSIDTTNGVLVNGGASAQFTFTSANWLTSQTVTVSAVDDSSVEVSPHTALINHNIDGSTADFIYSGITINDVTANITDNDTAGVTITESGSTDVTEDGATDSYNIALTTLPTGNVVITITSQDSINGVLVNGAASAELTFTTANWSTAQAITVSPVNDLTDEDGDNNLTPHTAIIAHDINTSLTIDTDYDALAGSLGNVTANITDNDNAGVTITESTTTDVTEGGTTDSYDIVLTSKPTADVIIDITSDSQVTANGLGSTQVIFTSTNWFTTQTVTVAAVDDNIVESAHLGNITHAVNGSSASEYIGKTINSVSVNITDNDNSPFITNVTSSTLDGSYKAGAVIPVQVVFDQIVFADTTLGTPSITLDVGTIVYSSGDGTDTLEFSYTVGAADISNDLKYLSTGSLALNGGTIKDVYGNDAALTLPTPGNTGSLSFNKNIVIDTALPSLNWVTSSTTDGTYGLGSVIGVEVVFSEPVFVTVATPKLTLETGSVDAVVNYSSGSGSNTLVFNYTVAQGHQSGDLDYFANNSLALAGAYIKDAAGNDASLILPNPGQTNSLSANKNIIVDGIIPVVTSVNSSTPNGSYKAGDTISIQIYFSHAVTVTGTSPNVPVLLLETGATDNSVEYTSGSGTNALTFNYTVNAGDTTSDLCYINSSSLSLAGGSTIKKTNGAPNDANITLPVHGGAGSLSSAKNIILDTTSPVINSITSSTIDGTYGEGTNINITVTISEPVTLSGGTLNVTLDTGDIISVSAGSYPASVLTGTYTVSAGDTSSDLDSTAIGLSGGASLLDNAGNTANLTMPAVKIATGSNIIIDTSVPAVTNVTSSTANGYYNEPHEISIQITFSENVDVDTGAGTPSLILNSGGSASYSSGTGTTVLTFLYSIAAGHNSSDLDYTNSAALLLNSGTIKKAGFITDANLSLSLPATSGSLGFNKNIVVDTTVPVISSITSTTPDGSYSESANINITVTLSEPVTLSVGTLDVTLDTGDSISVSAGAYPATILTGTYTVSAGDTSGDLNSTAIALNGGATLLDNAGNTATLTMPAVTIATNSAIVINTAVITSQFSTPVTSSGLENITTVNIPVELSTTAAADKEICYSVTGGSATGGGTDFTITASPVSIPAGSLTGNIQLTINNDTTDENDETIVITLDNVNGTSCVNPAGNLTHTYTITDDDTAPNVYFAAASSSTLDESVAVKNIAVNLSAASGKTVDVTVTVTGGSALLGTDYAFTSPSVITFNPGITSINLSYTVTADTDIEGDETIIFSLGAPVNATLGAATTHTSTITDDDGSPTLSVLDVSITEGNSGTSQAVVTVNMAGIDAGASVSVQYATSNGTADLSDYSSASGTLTWTAGQTGSKTFNVTINGDTLGETNETVIITLSNASVNASIIDATGILTINNDDATLTIASAETLDCDPINGTLDHYKITFSENITDSTFDGYLLNSEGATTSKWLIAGHTGIRLDHGSALNTICGSDTLNDNVLYIKFTESASVNTGIKPELTSSFATLSAVSGIGKLYYNTGNILTTDIIESDKAKPYVWYALASHGGGIDGSAGTSDTLEIRYSESVNAPVLTGVDLDTVFTLNNSHDFGSSADITSTVWSGTIYTNDTLLITFASDNPTVYDGDLIKASGSLIKDTSNNLPANTANVLSPPQVTGTFDGGARGPIVISAEYKDIDLNGFIDHVKITFDKNVDETTFPGYIGDNQINTVTTIWQVAGYNNVALDTSDSLDTSLTDNIIWLKFSESSDYDTGAKPDLTATLGAAALRDAVDTCYINTSPINCLDSSQARLLTADVSEKDTALPILTLAVAKENDRLLFVWFSENVWSNINMPACGAGGQLTAADFAYNDINAGGASSVTSLDFDDCASDDGFARLLTDNLFVLADIQNDQVSAAASEIYDAANNAMTAGNWQTIVETTAPYLLTASSFYNTTNSTYWLRIAYSEPMESIGATTAANYTISVDTAGSCNTINAVPHTVKAVSTTIFDLQTDAQCGDTVYKILASNNIYNANQIEPVASPNEATTIGTDSIDTTIPRLLQALSLSSTSVQLTYSEPMRAGDQTGSAECNSSFIAGGVTCIVDVDTVLAGSQTLYTNTPSLGTVLSVSATSDPSVFILTHNDVQFGSFYTVTPYAGNGVSAIPKDLAGNNLSLAPENRATFQGNGTIVDALGEGSLFVDPFADGTSFSFAFNYQNRIYLGPNDENSGAFRFEADGNTPIMTTFFASGGTCASTGTFGYGPSPATCDTDLGPNGERGIVGFNSGIITTGGEDFEILMVGPLKDGVGHTYFTTDIDTTLDWTGCAFSATGGANTKSVQTAFALGDSYFAGLSSNQGTQAPILVRQRLTNSGGILSCGTASDLSVRSLADFGKGGNNLKNTSSIVGVDSMAYAEAGSINTNPHFYMANNGSLYAWNITTNGDIPNTTGTWTKVFTWSAKDGANPFTLVLPSLEKIRPGEKGVPYIQKWNNALYLVRNLTSASGGTTSTGGQIWKCTSACNTSGGWTKIVSSANFIDGTTGGTKNTSIGLFQINEHYLYIGFDNAADGVMIYKSNEGLTEVTSEADFTLQDKAGLSDPVAYKYIFSSASLDKQGKHYIYVTVGDSFDAIKVIRQVD